MARNKVLTREELIKILKEMGIATKKDLESFATKKDLVGVAMKKDLVGVAMKKDLNSLERKLVIRMNKMERSLRQSIADLAETTPTRQEFEELKLRVSGKYGFI